MQCTTLQYKLLNKADYSPQDSRFYTVAESSLRAQELSSLKTEARIFQQQVMEFGVKLAAKHVQIIIFEVCSSDRQRSRDKDAFDAALNAATDVFEQEGEESERGEQMYMDAIMKGTTLFPEAQAELWEFWQRRELWMVWRRGGWLL